jgi:2-methylcitrate dehydratase
MECVEDQQYTTDYLDPEKRFISNALKVTLKDGTVLDEVEIHYPVGHKRRRAEGAPLIEAKFERHMKTKYSPEQVSK